MNRWAERRTPSERIAGIGVIDIRRRTARRCAFASSGSMPHRHRRPGVQEHSHADADAALVEAPPPLERGQVRRRARFRRTSVYVRARPELGRAQSLSPPGPSAEMQGAAQRGLRHRRGLRCVFDRIAAPHGLDARAQTGVASAGPPAVGDLCRRCTGCKSAVEACGFARDTVGRAPDGHRAVASLARRTGFGGAAPGEGTPCGGQIVISKSSTMVSTTLVKFNL